MTYPRVYHTFKARDLHGNNDVEFRVEDFPRDRIEEGIQYMIKYFFEQEVMGKARNVNSDEEAVADISQLWREELSKGFSIACFKQDSDEIISMHISSIKTLNDKKSDENFKSKNMKDIFGVMEYAAKQCNVFEYHTVDKYLSSYGLCVHPDYRGKRIATEMLKARAPLSKALNLKVTTAAFSGVDSQKAAENAGYEEIFTITYEELYKINSEFNFPGITSTHFKIMSLTV